MIDQTFQNRIANLVLAGEVEAVHNKFMGLQRESQVPFSLFKEWLDIVSCTGVMSVDEALPQVRLQSYNETEVSIINSYQAVAYWLDWNVQGLDHLFKSAIGRAKQERVNIDAIHAQAHMKLCARLFMHRLQNPQRYESQAGTPLFVIGDSHSLVLAGRSMQWNGRSVMVNSMPIRGIKMFHLGAGKPSKFRSYFKKRLKLLPQNSDILLSIGEIDCRPNEGIFSQIHKVKNVDLALVIQNTIVKFIEYVSQALNDVGISPNSITLMGVPQPGYDIARGLPSGATIPQFLEFIDKVNVAMCHHAHAVGWSFLDINAATKHKMPQNAAGYRLDDFHLSPDFYDDADQWVIRL